MYQKVSIKDLLNKPAKFQYLEVDIHGMSTVEAKKSLEKALVNISSIVKELRVVHGYNTGDSLKTMVTKELKSKKIKNKMPDMFNSGATILFLKQEK